MFDRPNRVLKVTYLSKIHKFVMRTEDKGSLRCTTHQLNTWRCKLLVTYSCSTGDVGQQSVAYFALRPPAPGFQNTRRALSETEQLCFAPHNTEVRRSLLGGNYRNKKKICSSIDFACVILLPRVVYFLVQVAEIAEQRTCTCRHHSRHDPLEGSCTEALTTHPVKSVVQDVGKTNLLWFSKRKFTSLRVKRLLPVLLALQPCLSHSWAKDITAIEAKLFSAAKENMFVPCEKPSVVDVRKKQTMTGLEAHGEVRDNHMVRRSFPSAVRLFDLGGTMQNCSALVLEVCEICLFSTLGAKFLGQFSLRAQFCRRYRLMTRKKILLQNIHPSV